MMLVYITSPQYIALLWTDPLGRLMLAGSAVWMSCGVLVMKKDDQFRFLRQRRMLEFLDRIALNVRR